MAVNHHPASDRPLHRWARPLTALLLAALITGFYWKLVFSDQFTWLQSPDIANQVIPWYNFEASEFHRGRIPLGDPNHWAGQSLLAQAQPGVAYPFNWILFSLPLRNGWVKQVYLHWYFIAIHLLAAFAAYRLSRDLGCRRSAAVFGGCIFALGGWMATADWPQALNSALWTPLVLMHILRAWRGLSPARAGLFAGFFLGLSWLAGHHQVPTCLTLAAAALWLAHIIRQRFDRRAIAGALLCAAIAFTTGAAQLLPSMEYGRLSTRWVNLERPVAWNEKVPFEVHRAYRLEPASLPGLIFPGMWNNAGLFVGACAIVFVILGIALAWKLEQTKPIVFVAVGAVLYSWAGYSIFHGWIYALLPMVDKARNVSWAVLPMHAALAALASLGLEAWLSNPDSPWVSRACRVAALFAFVVFGIFAGRMIWQGYGLQVDDRPLAVAVVALLTAGVLLWRPRQAAVLVVLLFLFEAGLENTYNWQTVLDKNRIDYYSTYQSAADIYVFLSRQPGRPRIDVDRAAVPFNAGDLYGFAQLNGYLTSLTNNIYHLGTHDPAVQNLLGAEYSIRNSPTPVFRDQVFQSAGGLQVFRNPDAFPRAFAVHEAIRGSSPPPGLDLRRVTFLESEPPPLARCPGDDLVEITYYVPNEVRLHARMNCTGMVILTDTFYPGWRAELDGRSVRIYEAYAALRGVVVDSGDHTLVFRYRPASVYGGAALSLLSFLFVAGCALWKNTAASR